MKITFLGAAGTVTGSKYLVEAAGARVMIDCGLFQGFKQLRLRNWAKLPVSPESVDAVVLTHAHLDHSGYLPLFAKNGFRGPVHCTQGTRDLCGILLPDSGHILEKDADFANRHGFSKHAPALPLYTQAEAESCLRRFASHPFNTPVSLAGGLIATFLRAGHILGASLILLKSADGQTILFSGDLGRPHDVTMLDPAVVERADYLVLESTYGDRNHDRRDAEELLAGYIARTAKRGGTVIIPAFAVGRTQSLLVHLHRLKLANRIPNLPIFMDSPMAIDASDIFVEHPNDHRMTAGEARAAFGVARYVQWAADSKTLDANRMPKVILCASGMATGGRVLHHLKAYAPDPRNLILLSGFQVPGTRGADMVAGAKEIKIHGEYIPVRAEVANLDMLSAHADAGEILTWLRNFKAPPTMTFLVHGEPAAADALRKRIQENLRWPCTVPEYRDTIALP
jgi:metallo-beta-lactamase family protein